MAKLFNFHLYFRYIFIYLSDGIYTNLKNSYIKRYLLTKCLIFSTACLFLYILMPFKISISKSVLTRKIVMPFYSWNKKEDIDKINVVLWFIKIVKQFSKGIFMM